jgi:hypothetical protein
MSREAGKGDGAVDKRGSRRDASRASWCVCVFFYNFTTADATVSLAQPFAPVGNATQHALRRGPRDGLNDIHRCLDCPVTPVCISLYSFSFFSN